MAWFDEWFDTPYYDLLYKNRNEEEARSFLKNLLQVLHVPKGSSVLDMPCGKGRHSWYLSAQGYRVTGADLSISNIEAARQEAGDGPEFLVHDLRLPLAHPPFDLVLNLFTSLGYSEEPADTRKSVHCLAGSLASSGWLVIDFMNVDRIIPLLPKQEIREEKGIVFTIQKRLAGLFIEKEISFQDGGRSYRVVERVQALRKQDLETLAAAEGLILHACFGSYELTGFDPASSDRLILVFQQKDKTVLKGQ